MVQYNKQRQHQKNNRARDVAVACIAKKFCQELEKRTDDERLHCCYGVAHELVQEIQSRQRQELHGCDPEHVLAAIVARRPLGKLLLFRVLHAFFKLRTVSN